MTAETTDSARGQIRSNIEVHDRISGKYDSRHGEIFNIVEQGRLGAGLERAIASVATGSESLSALDFGCGSGNLTRHLLTRGLAVKAADVSESFLTLVRDRFPGSALSTQRLNGTDLRELADNSFDLVAAYSVLHHIPDYLAAVKELARVCRPGGVIYLDHEPTEDYWTRNPAYLAFRSEASRFNWKKYLVLGNYVGKIRRLFDPRYTNEGDIHVWPDDHVEWGLVASALTSSGCEILFAQDYLLFRSEYRPDVYDRYRNALTDTRVMAFRKL